MRRLVDYYMGIVGGEGRKLKFLNYKSIFVKEFC